MMSDNEPIVIENGTAPRPESEDSDYLAWKKAKIKAALEHARTNPDDVSTHDQVFDEIKEKFRP